MAYPWLGRYLMLAATVPDCRAPRTTKFYLATAVLATAWVGIDSWFLLVWTLKVTVGKPCWSLET